MRTEVRTAWNSRTRRFTIVLAIVLALVFGYAARAYAAPGDLDPSFDGDGRLTTDFSNNFDRAFDLAVQEDGKLVAAGYAGSSSSGQDFALARYNADGTLDASFGTGGKATTPVTPGFDVALAVTIQPDGRIVTAGYADNGTSGNDFAVARYNPDGSLDTSFSGDGMVLTPVGSGIDQAADVAMQGDKVVVAGYTTNGSQSDFALVRYDSNGNLDSTFGSNGVVKTDFFTSNDAAEALAVEPDGKIVLAGYTFNPNNVAASNDFALARYEANGSLDTTFGTGGKAVTHFGYGIDLARDVTIQEDGKIVAAGRASSGSQNDFALARYNTNGSLDGEFDFDGRAMTDFGSAEDLAYGLALQDDARIVAAGSSGGDFALARYNPDGSLSNSFNHDGRLKTNFGASDDSALALAVQDDSKIVATGSAYNGASSHDLALARYFGGNDANPPRVRTPGQTLVAGSALGTSGVTTRLSWSAADAEGEISSYQLQQSVDGGAYQNVTLPSATTTSIQPSLAFDSNYRFRVRSTDDNGNQSFWKYGPRFVVDDRQENESGVSYPKGIWKAQELSGAHGGQVKYATAKGATARFTFTGRSVAWVAPKSSTRGMANVYLDGVKVATGDLFSRSTLSRQVVFSAKTASIRRSVTRLMWWCWEHPAGRGSTSTLSWHSGSRMKTGRIGRSRATSRLRKERGR